MSSYEELLYEKDIRKNLTNKEESIRILQNGHFRNGEDN